MDVSFYYLTSLPLLKALPRLVAKMVGAKKRSTILCKDEEQMKNLDQLLWTFASKEFIPHDIIPSHDAQMHSVLLTCDKESIIENFNDSEILIILDNIDASKFSEFKKHFYMFYGNTDESEVKEHLIRYRKYRSDTSIDTIFWKQNQDNGSWVKIDS